MEKITIRNHSELTDTNILKTAIKALRASKNELIGRFRQAGSEGKVLIKKYKRGEDIDIHITQIKK